MGRLFVVLLGMWALQGNAFDLQAHRGGRGLMPENTLVAFENAIRLGVTTLDPSVFVQVLLPVIREAGMLQRVMIQSFDWRTLQLVQRIEPTLCMVYLTAQSCSFNNLSDGSWTV